MSEEIMTSAADLNTVIGLRAENDGLRQRMNQAERENAELRRAHEVAMQENDGHHAYERTLVRELVYARAVVAAARRIDKHVVGAYETGSGDVEPCDECGEMREIAAQALAAYDAAVKARG